MWGTWWFMGHFLLDPSKETHSKDHGKQLGRGGGKKRAKTKQRTINVSCIFQKIGKALPGSGTTPIAPSCPALSDAERGTLTAQERLWQNSFPCPFLPPKLLVAPAAAWLHSQTAPGVTGAQDPWSLLCASLLLPGMGTAQPLWEAAGPFCPDFPPLHNMGDFKSTQPFPCNAAGTSFLG